MNGDGYAQPLFCVGHALLLANDGLPSWSGEVLAIGLFKDQQAPELESRWPGLSQALSRDQFNGKAGQQLILNLLGNSGPQRLVVLGLGDAAGFNLDGVRSAAANAAKAAGGCSGQLGLQLNWEGLEPTAAAAAAAEAVRPYADQRFRKSAEPKVNPEVLELIGLPPQAAAGFDGVNADCAGVELARELVASPPIVVTPAALAQTASDIAETYGLELTVLEGADCEARGMGAFLAVSQGSDLDPKLIHLVYRPQGDVKRLAGSWARA